MKRKKEVKKITTTVAPVKLSHIEQMIASIKKNTSVDVDLTFEFILASLFPTCWNNIQKDLNKQYTLGYLAGKAEAEENLKKQ